jgi:hypothetical protein
VAVGKPGGRCKYQFKLWTSERLEVPCLCGGTRLKYWEIMKALNWVTLVPMRKRCFKGVPLQPSIANAMRLMYEYFQPWIWYCSYNFRNQTTEQNDPGVSAECAVRPSCWFCLAVPTVLRVRCLDLVRPHLRPVSYFLKSVTNERKFCRLEHRNEVRMGGVLAMITCAAMLAVAETPRRATQARQDKGEGQIKDRSFSSRLVGGCLESIH